MVKYDTMNQSSKGITGMTTFSQERPLVASKIEDLHVIQVACKSNIWHIQVEVTREDSVWIGTAAACCEKKSVPVLRALRYGPTAQEAESAAIETLREAIADTEGQSEEEKELR